MDGTGGNSNSLKSFFEGKLGVANTFVAKQNVKREAYEPLEDGNVFKYEIEIPFCIFTDDGMLIADVYDVEPEHLISVAMKAYMDAFYSDDCPAFIFLFDGDIWKGLSMYSRKSTKPESICYKNAYDKMRIDFSFSFDNEFYLDLEKKLWNVTATDMVEMIKEVARYRGLDKLLFDGLRSEFIPIISSFTDKDLRSRITDFLNTLQTVSQPFEIGQEEFYFASELENRFFQSVLGGVNSNKLIRFTTLCSLASILQHQSHLMFSIASMNDTAECSYANQYIQEQSSTDEHEDYIANYFNNYITSCSICEKDDLTMWRLYGDNTKGVAIVYNIENIVLPKDFHLAPVSYPNKYKGSSQHETLELVKCIMNSNIEICHRQFKLKRWKVWQRFFKSEKYAVEKEIRLLYSPLVLPKYDKWKLTPNNVFSPYVSFPLEGNENYPLEIERILLGPNCPEKETNKVLINELLDDLGLKCDIDIINDLHFRP